MRPARGTTSRAAAQANRTRPAPVGRTKRTRFREAAGREDQVCPVERIGRTASGDVARFYLSDVLRHDPVTAAVQGPNPNDGITVKQVWKAGEAEPSRLGRSAAGGGGEPRPVCGPRRGRLAGASGSNPSIHIS